MTGCGLVSWIGGQVLYRARRGTGEIYTDLGGDYYTRRDPEIVRNYFKAPHVQYAQ